MRERGRRGFIFVVRKWVGRDGEKTPRLSTRDAMS